MQSSRRATELGLDEAYYTMLQPSQHQWLMDEQRMKGERSKAAKWGLAEVGSIEVSAVVAAATRGMPEAGVDHPHGRPMRDMCVDISLF